MLNTEYTSLSDDFKNHLKNIYERCQLNWLNGEPELRPQLSKIREGIHYSEFMSSFYDSNFRDFGEKVEIVFVRSYKYDYSFDVCVYVNGQLFDSIYIGYADAFQAEQAKIKVESFLSQLVKRKSEIKAKAESERLKQMFASSHAQTKRKVL